MPAGTGAAREPPACLWFDIMTILGDREATRSTRIRQVGPNYSPTDVLLLLVVVTIIHTKGEEMPDGSWEKVRYPFHTAQQLSRARGCLRDFLGREIFSSSNCCTFHVSSFRDARI